MTVSDLNWYRFFTILFLGFLLSFSFDLEEYIKHSRHSSITFLNTWKFIIYSASSCEFNSTPGTRFSKAPETFRSAKPFLVDVLLRSERCMRLKLLVCRKPLFVLIMCK